MKRLLVVDDYWKRHQLQWELYQYWKEKYPDNVFIVDSNTDLSTVQYEFDVVLYGMIYNPRINIGQSFEKSSKYIAENNIKVVLDNADIECFMASPKILQMLQSGLITTIASKYINNELKRFLKQFDIKCVWMPWCISNIEKIDDNCKDLEFSFMATINNDWRFHSTRKTIVQHLSSLSMPNVIGTGNVDSYFDVLKRSKIFVVEGSMRNIMSAKYLEAGICRCLLIGDVPIRPKQPYFVDKATMIAVSDWTHIDELIKYYLDCPDERMRIIEDCEKTIREHLTHNTAGENYWKLLTD